jgi:hypothetical protein
MPYWGYDAFAYDIATRAFLPKPKFAQNSATKRIPHPSLSA